jgi:hypothetical protein
MRRGHFCRQSRMGSAVHAKPHSAGPTARVTDCVRIPLILISHSGRLRSPIPVILITLFTMPEESTATA